MHALLHNENFPQELLDAPVWCVASPDSYGKLKIPMDPYTRKRADVTDPNTWGTFEDACTAAAEMGFYLPDTDCPAVGHVLRIQDAIFVIDFDKAYLSADRWRIQSEVMELFESYVEESQSGTGMHLYARGCLFKGKRFKGAEIEMYGHARFIVVTGRAVDDRPIEDHTLTMAHFIAEHAPQETNFVFNGDAPYNMHALQKLFDNTFVREAFLTPGGWREYFGDIGQSIPDSVFMKEILRVTDNHLQALEIFSASPMGARDKWIKREDYRQRTLKNAALELDTDKREESRIAAAFALCIKTEIDVPVVPTREERQQVQAAPVADFSNVPPQKQYLPSDVHIRVPVTRMYMGVTEQLTAAQELLPLPVYPTKYLTDAPPVWERFIPNFENPAFTYIPLPGFLGEFAAHIAKRMFRPSVRLAEVAVIQIAQMCVGRGAFVMNTGLNTYHVITGGSGVGKSTARDIVSDFMGQMSERYQLRPFRIGDKPKSKEGLHQAIMRSDSPEYMVTIDEAHTFIGDIELANKNGGMASGIATLLTDLYHKSDIGKTLQGSEASKIENSTTAIKRPFVVLSMFGLHDEMLEGITPTLMKNGFMSRLMFTHIRKEDVARQMNRRLKELRGYDQKYFDRCALIARFFDKYGAEDADPFEIYLPEHVAEKHAQFSDWATELAEDHNKAHFNRVSVNALKMAALLAIFNDPKACVITEELYDWAASYALSSVNYLESAVCRGEVGNKYDAMRNTIISRLMRYYEIYNTIGKRRKLCEKINVNPVIGEAGLIPYSWILSQISNVANFKAGYTSPSKALLDMLRGMDGEGVLEFYHQDHKKTFQFVHPQTGSVQNIKAAAVNASGLIKSELAKRAHDDEQD